MVVGTALNTAMGKIREEIENTDSGPSPLQKKLDDFGDLLSKVITVICIVVWLINIGQFGNEEHGGYSLRLALRRTETFTAFRLFAKGGYAGQYTISRSQ